LTLPRHSQLPSSQKRKRETIMAADVREWARANGFTVADKGRIAPAIHKAYREANGEREAPTGAARCQCGRVWTGLRECHCRVCHLHFSSVRWFDVHWRHGEGRQCRNPLTILRGDGEPMFKVVDNAWGELIVSNTERPEFDTDDDTLL